MTKYGPPGASNNGFNENLTLFQQGKCGMWIDATVAASFVTGQGQSTVADKVGFALAPDNGLGKRGNWLWAWSLAIPASSQKPGRGQDLRQLGDQQGLSGPRRLQGRLGQRSSGHAHLALCEPGIRQGALRQDDASTRSTRLTRPIRRSSRCPMSACSSSRSRSSGHRHGGGRDVLGRAGRAEDR